LCVQKKKKEKRKNLSLNEYSLYFSSATFFLYSEQNRSTHIERERDGKKQDAQAKEKGKYTLTHNTITEMMYCTEGKKPELCMCVQREEKKRRKKK